MSITNDKYLTNKLICEKTKAHMKNLPKTKPQKLLIIFSVLGLLSFIAGIAMFFVIGKYALYVLIITVVSLVMFLYEFNKYLSNRKVTLSKYIEVEYKKYASENGLLPISPVFPYFLKVDDDTKELKIYFDDELILDTDYYSIKNYRIYYNKTNETKKRLPQKPIKGVGEYLIEINLKDGSSSKLEFINRVSLFMVNSKLDYLQFVNTESINNLAIILDKVLIVNKK